MVVLHAPVAVKWECPLFVLLIRREIGVICGWRGVGWCRCGLVRFAWNDCGFSRGVQGCTGIAALGAAVSPMQVGSGSSQNWRCLPFPFFPFLDFPFPFAFAVWGFVKALVGYLVQEGFG